MKASFLAGSPQKIEYKASFVDGIGGKSVLEEMWSLVKSLIHNSLVMSLEEVASALKILIERNRIIAEGAGATPVAAALSGMAGKGKIVCVVSGGNIDIHQLMKIISD